MKLREAVSDGSPLLCKKPWRPLSAPIMVELLPGRLPMDSFKNASLGG